MESKKQLKDTIQDLLSGSEKEKYFIKLFVRATRKDEPRLYKQIENDRDLNITGVSEETLEAIITLRNTQ